MSDRQQYSFQLCLMIKDRDLFNLLSENWNGMYTGMECTMFQRSFDPNKNKIIQIKIK